MKYSITILYVFFSLNIMGQQVVAEFDIKDLACQNELINISNNTQNSTKSNWDFCIGDFRSIPTIENNISAVISSSNGFKLLKDADKYYGFSISRSNLYRMDFGENINTEPQITDLGDLGVLTNAEGIDIVKEGNKWIGFVGFGASGNGGEIFRIVWEDLNSLPSAESLGNFGISNRIRDIEVIDENNIKIMLLPFYNGKLARIDFGESFLNTPQNTIVSQTLENVEFPVTLSTIEKNGNWYVILGSLITKTVSVFNLGTDLFADPIHVKSESFEDYNFISKLKVIREGKNFYAIISTLNSPLHLVDLKSLEASDNFEEIMVDNMPSVYGIDFLNEASKQYVFGIQSQLQRLTFERDCSVSQDYNITEFEPDVSYSQPGTYQIDLTAYNEEGESDYITKEITVTSDIAPDIYFDNLTLCAAAPVQFEHVNNSGDLSSFLWDFGDNTTSTDPNPSHIYATPGEYAVKLSVTSVNGCSNYSEKLIIVYPEPSPSFDLPSGLVCTNDTYTFENTTLGDFDGNISWEWQIDGNVVSTDHDLNYEFTNNGAHEVKLVAILPGCSAEVTQVINNIQEGPTANFNADDDCVGKSFQFNNTSSGDITSFQWDFGNGFTSSLESPSFEYAAAGTYEVTLTLSNATGCQSDMIKSVNVYELPNVQFNNELACEGSPTQFNDASQVGDANLQAWRWDFDDEDISEDRNPLHNFENAGNYDVKLTVTTTNGCIDSIEHVVNVKAAPKVDFSYDKLCIDEIIQFDDETEPAPGQDIVSWAWDLGGVFSAEQNPQRSFEFPIGYNIGLTVGSENLCSATLYKSIQVNPAPDVIFAAEDACSNAVTHFYDQTVLEGDKIINRNWDMENAGIASDSSFYFKFPGLGVYDIELTINTANGCSYNTLQEIEIFPSPKAKFSSSVAFGAPPLEVQFRNESEGADKFLWDFNDGEGSSESDPDHIFINEGNYKVQLIASDINQCRDTVSQVINVLDPDLELELVNAFLQNQSVILTLRNNGTIAIDSLLVRLDLGGQAILNETVIETIMPSGQINATLKPGISNINVKYICIDAQALVEGIGDSKLNNNNKCLNINTADIVILPPKPNPANSQIYINIISKGAQTADFYIYDTKGQLLKQINTGEINVGFNQVAIDISDLPSALYVLKVRSGSQVSSFRLMVHEM